MQRLEVSGAVQPLQSSLGVKGLRQSSAISSPPASHVKTTELSICLFNRRTFASFRRRYKPLTT